MSPSLPREEGDPTPLQRYEFEFNLARGHNAFRQRKAVAEMGKIARISHTIYSQIRLGKSRAHAEQCLAFARYFDRPLESVLKDFGYPYVDSLIVAVEGRRDLEDQKYILDMLKLSRHNVWMEQTDWRTSPYKDHAEWVLTRSADPIEKARLYADEVYAWMRDVDRDQSRAQRNSDDKLAVVTS